MKNWQPIDILVGFMVFGVVTSVTVFIVDVAINDDPLNDTQSKRVTTIVTTILAIISMYVGAKIQANKDCNDKEDKKVD